MRVLRNRGPVFANRTNRARISCIALIIKRLFRAMNQP